MPYPSRLHNRLGETTFSLKPMGLNMEGDMTDYYGLMVLFLLLPVVVQIIIPLLMLVGFGLIYLLRTVFAKRTIMNTAKFDPDNLMELQSSRS